MNKEFIPYEQALELKELGFNEVCYNHYSERDGESLLHLMSSTPIKNETFITYKGCAAPLYQQAFRWFREEYGLTSWIKRRKDFVKEYSWYILCDDQKMLDKYAISEYLDYDLHIETHEEAELACIKKLIETVNKNRFYQFINEPVKEINGKTYVVETFNLHLKEFLKTYSDKDLYIYRPSVKTNQIRAIII